MATTEIPNDATALYWELDRLREQLSAAAEDYGMAGSGSLLDVLAGRLYEASESIAGAPAALAKRIVKTAGPDPH